MEIVITVTTIVAGVIIITAHIWAGVLVAMGSGWLGKENAGKKKETQTTVF